MCALLLACLLAGWLLLAPFFFLFFFSLFPLHLAGSLYTNLALPISLSFRPCLWSPLRPRAMAAERWRTTTTLTGNASLFVLSRRLLLYLLAIPSLLAIGAADTSLCSVKFEFPTAGQQFFYLDTINVTYQSDLSDPTLSIRCAPSSTQGWWHTAFNFHPSPPRRGPCAFLNPSFLSLSLFPYSVFF